jgi:hypothetical protein
MAIVCLTTLGFHANKPRGLHPSGMMVCTDPLPNERVPTSVARPVILQSPGDDFGGRVAKPRIGYGLVVDLWCGS